MLTAPAEMPVNSSSGRIKEVGVSQATRVAATSEPYETIDLLKRQLKELKDRKSSAHLIHSRLYDKTAYLKRQQEIRMQGGDTLPAWIAERARMDAKKAESQQGLNEIELKISRVMEKLGKSHQIANDFRDRVFEAMLIELRQIRSLLERR